MRKRRILSLIDENREFLDGYSYSETKDLIYEKLKQSNCLFGPGWKGPEELIKKRGFYLNVNKLGEIGKKILQGLSEYKISKEVKCHISVVKEFKKYIGLTNPEINCKCGRIQNHRGVCNWKLFKMRKKHPENLRYR